MPRMNQEWWRAHFRHAEDLWFWLETLDLSQADQLIPFLVETLDLPQQGRLLDVGCGDGAHAIRLAQWGYQVTAVETAETLIDMGKRQSQEWNLDIDFRQVDVREIPERREFDAALRLDFGAFSEADNAARLRAIAAALKPGGKIVIGLFNAYYWATNPQVDHWILRGTDFIEQFSFDFETGSVLHDVRSINPEGERRRLPTARYRAYTLPEICRLIESVGLSDLKVYGHDAQMVPRTDLPVNGRESRFFYLCASRTGGGEAGAGI